MRAVGLNSLTHTSRQSHAGVRHRRLQNGCSASFLVEGGFDSQCQIIDTQDSWTTLFTFVGKGVQQVKQRIGADGYADFARQTSATLATSLQCKRSQQVGRIVRPPGVVSQYTIETLGEDLTRTIWHIAEPPLAMNTQAHGTATPGQVKRSPHVAAVLTLA